MGLLGWETAEVAGDDEGPCGVGGVVLSVIAHGSEDVVEGGLANGYVIAIERFGEGSVGIDAAAITGWLPAPEIIRWWEVGLPEAQEGVVVVSLGGGARVLEGGGEALRFWVGLADGAEHDGGVKA